MSIANSSWPVPTATSFATVQVGHAIDFSDALTGDDKRLVLALTGYDADAPFDPADDHAVPELAAAIAIARAVGSLTGPVTRGFVRGNLGEASERADAQPGGDRTAQPQDGGARCAA